MHHQKHYSAKTPQFGMGENADVEGSGTDRANISTNGYVKKKKTKLKKTIYL